MRARSSLALLTLLALAPACTELGPDDLDTSDSPLLVPDGVELWTARGNVVPVCFLNGTDLDHALVRAAVERTWVAAAAIAVDWRGGCSFTGEAAAVRVSIRHDDRGSYGTATIGTAAASLPWEPVWCSGADGWFVPCRGVSLVLGDDRAAAEHAIIHEFGHVLGFGDEEFADEWYVGACRPGAHAEPGVYRGGFDRHSVMYTCGARRSMLSAGDRFHAAVLYGARPDRRDRLADLDGNGAAEPIATNVDHTWALRSGGFGFYDFHWLAGPFYGTRATLYGDVNGDGSDDAVAINADGAYVAVSNGTTLVFAGRWATTPFSRTANPARPSDDGVHVFLGEVTGDELADLVSVDRSGNIWVQASTGTAFVRPYRDGFWGLTQEAMPFQIDLADLDGDRKADLIETSVDRFAVHASTGRSFRNAVYAFPRDGMPRIDRGLAFGDVDGDRGADAIIVGYDHLTVLRKLTDRDVVTAERWTAAPLWGTRATLVADINGDERVDVVAVNDDADWVAVSNGNEFLPFGLPWTSGPFYSLP